MTNTVTSSAVSTNVDTAEAVPTADQWLEALGGAPVRITNALKTSHPREAWDTATTAADPFPLSQSTDQSLVELAEELACIFDEGVTVTHAEITSALIAVLALRRQDQRKHPCQLTREKEERPPVIIRGPWRWEGRDKTLNHRCSLHTLSARRTAA